MSNDSKSNKDVLLTEFSYKTFPKYHSNMLLLAFIEFRYTKLSIFSLSLCSLYSHFKTTIVFLERNFLIFWR